MLKLTRGKQDQAVAAQEPDVAAGPVPQDETAGRDLAEPAIMTTLTEFSPPGDYAAEAARLHAYAETAGEAAAQAIAEADDRLAEVTAQAAKLVADARAARSEVVAIASRGQRAADAVAELAGWVSNGGAERAKLSDAAARATALTEEREQVVTRADELGAELDRRRGERQEAEQRLAVARENGDAAVIGETLTLLTGMDDVARRLTGQLTAARDRIAAIGDGSPNFPGELAGALGVVAGRRRSLRIILNTVYPQRAEAVADAAQEELMGAIEGNLERIREEADQAGRKPKAPTVMSGPNGQIVVTR